MKKFYTDFVKHCIKFYCLYPTQGMDNEKFRSEADKKNWTACKKVFDALPHSDFDMLNRVYCSKDTIEDAVYEASVHYDIDQTIIWKTMERVERMVARKRGLI